VFLTSDTEFMSRLQTGGQKASAEDRLVRDVQRWVVQSSIPTALANSRKGVQRRPNPTLLKKYQFATTVVSIEAFPDAGWSALRPRSATVGSSYATSLAAIRTKTGGSSKRTIRLRREDGMMRCLFEVASRIAPQW
jgi:hypothetical protein